MQCLPDSLRDRRYYQPTQEGRERLLGQRMEEIQRLKKAKEAQPEEDAKNAR
jgi:putative ATPase